MFNKQNFVLLVATVLLVAISNSHYGDSILYPIRLFITIVHEMSHGVAALATGGDVSAMEIHADMSGLTFTQGGIDWVISMAGYVGTVFVGLFAWFLLRTLHQTRMILLMFAGVAFMAVAYTGLHDVFGTAWCLGIAIGFTVMALFVGPVADIIAGVVTIQLILGAFYDLKVLFMLSGTGVHTDALNMEMATGIPAVVWAVLWLGISILAALFALKMSPLTIDDKHERIH